MTKGMCINSQYCTSVDKSSFLTVYVSSYTYTCRLHKTPEHGLGSSKQEIKAIILGEFAHMELQMFYVVISMDSLSHTHKSISRLLFTLGIGKLMNVCLCVCCIIHLCSCVTSVPTSREMFFTHIVCTQRCTQKTLYHSRLVSVV